MISLHTYFYPTFVTDGQQSFVPQTWTAEGRGFFFLKAEHQSTLPMDKNFKNQPHIGTDKSYIFLFVSKFEGAEDKNLLPAQL